MPNNPQTDFYTLQEWLHDGEISQRKFEEQSYKDIDQKNRVNAEILHQKKEKVEEQFKLLRPVMMAAKETVRAQLNVA